MKNNYEIFLTGKITSPVMISCLENTSDVIKSH